MSGPFVELAFRVSETTLVKPPSRDDGYQTIEFVPSVREVGSMHLSKKQVRNLALYMEGAAEAVAFRDAAMLPRALAAKFHELADLL